MGCDLCDHVLGCQKTLEKGSEAMKRTIISAIICVCVVAGCGNAAAPTSCDKYVAAYDCAVRAREEIKSWKGDLVSKAAVLEILDEALAGECE